MRRIAVGIVALVCAAAAHAASSQTPAPTTMQVFKSATCGCCAQWVDQLRAQGFTVQTTNTETLEDIKNKHGIPARTRSCHTAVAGGYVFEGHVPVADIKRVLKERPAIAGLAVPGMPVGSPGMEVPGVKPDPYDVVAFDKSGATRVFASYNK